MLSRNDPADITRTHAKRTVEGVSRLAERTSPVIFIFLARKSPPLTPSIDLIPEARFQRLFDRVTRKLSRPCKQPGLQNVKCALVRS